MTLSREGEFTLKALNYIRGVRIVVYWLGTDKFLERLAQEHFGWTVHILGAPGAEDEKEKQKAGKRKPGSR